MFFLLLLCAVCDCNFLKLERLIGVHMRVCIDILVMAFVVQIKIQIK